MSFEVRAIREEEREECIALWCTIWPGDSDPYFRKYFFGDVEWLPYYTQVGVLDARLVSAAHVCKRVVACGDVRLTMGALANVVTLPEYRGKGYNTQ
jgi:predicted acetyltransferase